SKSSEPNFGLCDFRTLLRLVNGTEARVKLLRNISEGFRLHPNDIFIRYQASGEDNDRFMYTYASALQHKFETLKRSHDGKQRIVNSHIRWPYYPKDRRFYRPEEHRTEQRQPGRRQTEARH